MLTTLANLSSASSTQTSNTSTNSIQLPSFSTLMHHSQTNVASSPYHQLNSAPTALVTPQTLANIPLNNNLIKSTSASNLFQATQSSFPQLPPSLTITSNFVAPNQVQQQTQAVTPQKSTTNSSSTQTPSKVSNKSFKSTSSSAAQTNNTKIPPLRPTTPLSIINLPKLVPVSGKSPNVQTIAPTISQSAPPPLVKVTSPLKPKITLTPVLINIKADKKNEKEKDKKKDKEKTKEIVEENLKEKVQINAVIPMNVSPSTKQQSISQKPAGSSLLKPLTATSTQTPAKLQSILTFNTNPLTPIISKPKILETPDISTPILEKIDKLDSPPETPSTPGSSLIIESEDSIEIHDVTKDSDKTTEISIDIQEKSILEICQESQCAKSPILSQPKTIRFPPVNGKVTVWKSSTKGKGTCCVRITKNGMCNWENCSQKFDTNSELLDHLQQQHVNQQEGPFICSWGDCKVNGRESCSKRWLERHVLLHVGRGTKPFKCIVDRCGMRFSTQVGALINFSSFADFWINFIFIFFI